MMMFISVINILVMRSRERSKSAFIAISGIGLNIVLPTHNQL